MNSEVDLEIGIKCKPLMKRFTSEVGRHCKTPISFTKTKRDDFRYRESEPVRCRQPRREMGW